ncbi:MAG: response regulator transcription factor [Anaerolineae bacterium]
MKPKSVVIVDNHPVFRAGLKLVLETTGDFTIIGEASCGRDAIDLCQKLSPDVLLMDVYMPDGNGIETTNVLHRQFPKVHIIGVSAFRAEEMQEDMLRAGAIGFISKETDFEQMILQIRELVAKTISAQAKNDADTLFQLTHTERQVLALLAAGSDRQQIADQMSISYNTVKMHCRNIYSKLGVSTQQEAVNAALQYRLIT